MEPSLENKVGVEEFRHSNCRLLAALTTFYERVLEVNKVNKGSPFAIAVACPSLSKRTILSFDSHGVLSEVAEQANLSPRTSSTVRTGRCWLIYRWRQHRFGWTAV